MVHGPIRRTWTPAGMRSGPMWCHELCGTTWGPRGVTGCVTPTGPHVVPQAVWHHIGGPIWCHGLRGITWGPCGATGHVAPPGAHVMPQTFYFVCLRFPSHQGKQHAFYCVFWPACFENIGNFYVFFEMVEIIMKQHSNC